MRRWAILVAGAVLLVSVASAMMLLVGPSNSPPLPATSTSPSDGGVLPGDGASGTVAALPAESGTVQVVPVRGTGWVPALAPALTLRANMTSGGAWSPDGHLFGTAGPRDIRLWDATSGSLARTITLGRQSNRFFGWSPGGTRLLSSVPDATAPGRDVLIIWDAATGQPLSTVPGAGGSFSVAWAPDAGTSFNTAWSPSGRILAWTDGFTLGRWDSATGQALPKPEPTWPGSVAGVAEPAIGPIAWSPDGRILSGIQGTAIKFWDPQSGQEIAALTHTERVTGFAWSPDGRRIAAWQSNDQNTNATVVLWDVAARRQERTLSEPAGLTLAGFDWMAGGDVLVVSWASPNHQADRISLYGAATGRELRAIQGQTGTVLASPDGQTLAVVNTYDSVLTIWRPGSGTPAAAAPSATVADSCVAQWTVVPPAGGDKSVGVLEGVAALAPDSAWAVGSTNQGDQSASLNEHWDGRAWTLVRNPTVTGGAQYLHGLAALAPDDVWAVGEYSDRAHPSGDAVHTLAEHWDGKRWALVSSLDGPPVWTGTSDGMPMGSANVPGPPISSFLAVAAISAQDAWAVGYVGDTYHNDWSQPLIEHWDGAHWQIVPLDDLKLRGQVIGIAAPAANDVWAVDASVEGDSALIHWDGARWQAVQPLDRTNVYLTGVAAGTAGDVWVAGYQTMQAGNNAAILLHWDGHTWDDRSPADLTNDARPLAIAAGRTGVWTAGKQLLHLRGTAWTVQTLPGLHPNGVNDFAYHGVDAITIGGDAIWAVGDDGSGHPLVLRADLPPCDAAGH